MGRMGRIDTARRNRWISAVSRGNTVEKNIVESERVCDRHFVSGKLAASWDKHDFGWVTERKRTEGSGRKGPKSKGTKETHH